MSPELFLFIQLISLKKKNKKKKIFASVQEIQNSTTYLKYLPDPSLCFSKALAGIARDQIASIC
jgi:hypothetical protein